LCSNIFLLSNGILTKYAFEESEALKDGLVCTEN
jgi:hypothetical protein